MTTHHLLLSDAVAAAARPRAREYSIGDVKLPGLSLRVLPGGGKRWVMRLQIDGRPRRVTLGNPDFVPIEKARRMAHALLGGGSPDPARFRSSGLSFEAFAKVYRQRRARYWKPSTLEAHDSYLQSTLLPFFGAMPLEGIAATDVVRWFHDYGADRPGGANRALDILRGMFNWAKTWKMVPTTSVNPCRGITRYRRPPRGRLLNREDLQRLGQVLERYALIRPDQVDIIRLILLTGCRRGEIHGLRWKEVRADRLDLADSKTGPRTVLLGDAAKQLLQRRRKCRKGRARFVFPSPRDPSKPRGPVLQVWQRIRAEAGLADEIRLHDLRHTYASHALMHGETLMMAGRLLGHRNAATTERYAHLADRFLLDAAERVAGEILKLSNPCLG